MLTIGNLSLANRVVLAPMAGVTDLPFRKIVKTYGPGLVCGEMVSAAALHYQNQRTRELLLIESAERPVSIQLFGSNPSYMAEAAWVMAENGADLVDINMGCPVPKVVKNGEGAALLRNLPLAEKIIREVVRAVDGKLPVTVKMRLGWDHNGIVAPELAGLAEKCGAAAVTVHGRTRDQFYLGRADWNEIARVKNAVSIPVIGNGDVDSPEAGRRIIETTGCDGVMIGQAALGRPWIFQQVVSYLEEGVWIPEPPLWEQFLLIFRHLQLEVAYAGEKQGILKMRKHLAWYLKGMPGASQIKERIFTLTTWRETKETLKEYASSLGIEIDNDLKDECFHVDNRKASGSK